MKIEYPNVALLVHTCDRYAFLYKGFQIFFEKNWNSEVQCSYYFATEEKDFAFGQFKNIQSGNGEWADRLALLLKEKIKEKYILYFQEDMWLTSPVNKYFFDRLFALAEQHNWQQVKLHSSNAYVTKETDLFIEGFNVSQIDNKGSSFLMSHQVTLWNKEFLLKQLYKKEHPWRNERRGTQRLKKLNPQIFQIDYFAENGQPAYNNNQNLILRSGYYTVSINGMLGNTVEPYIKALLNEDEHPENKKYGLQLQHHYNNQLTHDGLSKPRKVDIFKRIKNWFQGK
ncbi:hypothetical protein [Niabella ginsengisoli]|uniref:Nucleotide-diphospho-sugar transferase domain-containing protein n=1 Tax=Niabella ginsengisoli TaxID=522298 RepID=A0ABS9SRA4_9BACT|nr:hypothetical protein [Niabella ginsengisoli]MCH5600914.1 hypothetical protein [Niabella ginsengisoli]